MTVNDFVKSEVEMINNYIKLIQGELDFIKEYGYVGMYGNSEELKRHLEEMLSGLKTCYEHADKATDIVYDQFSY